MENQEIEVVEKQSFGEKVEEFITDHYGTIMIGLTAAFIGTTYGIVKRSYDRSDAKTDMLTMMAAYQLGSQSKESK